MRAQRRDLTRPRASSPLPLAPAAALVAAAWLLPTPSAHSQISPQEPGRAGAQESEPSAAPPEHRALHPEAREAISKLRSPFCPGLMLEVCPSLDAQLLRDSLDAQARQGTSADSLVERMVAAYGEEYRAFPKRTGAGLLAWAVPPAGLLAGLGLAVVALRRLRGSARAGDRGAGAGEGADEGTGEGLTSEEEARLAAAMAEFDAMEEADA